jgi:hypothetical protein
LAVRVICGVDVSFVPHIEDAGGATAHCNGYDRNRRVEWIKVTRSNHQSDERGEDSKKHYARLHQRDEIAKARR